MKVGSMFSLIMQGMAHMGLLKMLRLARVKGNLKSITKGEEVAISEVNGLTLKVKRLKKED